jgi:hypothetical protein
LIDKTETDDADEDGQLYSGADLQINSITVEMIR